jgi:hypothetical protein
MWCVDHHLRSATRSVAGLGHDAAPQDGLGSLGGASHGCNVNSSRGRSRSARPDQPDQDKGKEDPMLYTIAIVLLVLWALGFFAFQVGGGLIHLLIVVAVIVLLFQLISGRRRL